MEERIIKSGIILEGPRSSFIGRVMGLHIARFDILTVYSAATNNGHCST